MSARYTAAEVAWLREHYHKGTIDDTLRSFEAEFGHRPSRRALFVKANKMGLRKDRHGDERHRKAEKTMRWSSPRLAREREWMLEHDTGESVFGTIEAFEAEFGVRLNRSQVSLFRSTHGTQKRVSHGGGVPARPVGSERLGKDGYVMVKVREWPEVPQSKDNWRFKHHLAWEEANGRAVPEGCAVFFADGDKRNFDPANLVLVPRKRIVRLNSPDTPEWHDAEGLRAVMAMLDLEEAVHDAEHRDGRPCAVCGGPIEETGRQRAYGKPLQTCRRCLDAGLRARGDRGDKRPTVCRVCGDVFERSSRSQGRCPACCAAKPHFGWRAHRRYFEIHGTRG